ncbi:MAG: hypothetical protein RBR43_03800 [Desulfuromonadaceae bacterium]|nr:hypothetical protein [Desulfuromonas sp.]MDY0184992.1 hypothetical protein [Desulfuromonadaceae bacterium]
MKLRIFVFACGVALAVTGSAAGVFALEDTANIESVEERRLLAELKQNRYLLDEKERELQNRELELNILQGEVDKKLDQLERLREQVEKMLAQKDEQELERINQLSQMYNRMEPAQAAEILLELDTQLAVGILGGMKARSAGTVLENMQGEKAAQISTAYATLKKN